MLESIKIGPLKPIREWFKQDVPSEALDLLVRMLQFNPHKRISMGEALRHPYLSQFHNSKEETFCSKPIVPPISDNKKLQMKQYKHLIYERVRKLYGHGKDVEEREYKKTPSSLHRSTEIMREKSN